MNKLWLSLQKHINLTSNRAFYSYLVLSLVLSVVISLTLVNGRAEEAIREVQSEAIEIESELTTSYLRQFIETRTQLLHDMARQPIFTNAVMGSGSSYAALIDYLDNYKILGRFETIALVNIVQESIYKTNDSLAQLIAQQPAWIDEVLFEKSPYTVVLTKQEQHYFFIISVPVRYNNLVEGALVVKFNTPLRQLLPVNYQSISHSITLDGRWVKYSSLSPNENYIRVSEKQIANTGIKLDYFIKGQELTNKVSGFMADITISLILALLLSTLMLLIFGRHLLLNPFQQLEASKNTLKLSEARYELAVKGSNDGIWDWEISTNAVYFSPRIKALLGYEEGDQYIPPNSIETFQSLMHPDDCDLNNKKIAQHLAQDTPYDHQYRLKTKHGEYRYFRAKGMALRNAEGYAIRMAGSITDITEQKLFQEALKGAKERNDLLAQAIESCHLGITIADATQKDLPIIFANSEFYKITGYTASEVIGQNCRMLQGKHTDKKAVDLIRSAIRTLNTERVEILNYKKNGQGFWNNLQVSPVFDDHNNLTAFIGIQQDITKQVQAKKSLIEAKAQAEQANKAKSEFLASMSHEIRTPMNGVIGMLNLLIDNSLNEKQHYQTQIALNSAKSLLNLINDILDFSKVDAGKLDIEQIEFDLRGVLDDYLQTATLQANDKNIMLTLDMSEVEETLVIGDPGRIRQIFTNLVNNAIKFTDHGIVAITVQLGEQEGKKLTLSATIKDTGIGICASQQAKLFQSFSQVDSSTTRKYGGTGLGLAIVKKLCNLMQGDVSVTSKEHEGSIFSFSVQLKASPNATKLSSEVALKQLHILIVDDDVHSLPLRKQLSKWGAHVVQSNDAKQILAACKTLKHEQQKVYDLIFFNKQHSVSNMCTINESLWQDPSITPRNSVLMLTVEQNNDELLNYQPHFNHVLCSPVTTKELLKTLKLCQVKSSSNKVMQPAVLQAPLAAQDIIWQYPIRILLVEDNQINQIVAKSTLHKLGLTRIDVANNGEEVLNILAKGSQGDQYALILMDCQMPVLDGYEATKAIRANEKKDNSTAIPIIAMTANAMVGDKEKCLAAGMNDYISKPIDESVLFNKLLQWLPYKISK